MTVATGLVARSLPARPRTSAPSTVLRRPALAVVPARRSRVGHAPFAAVVVAVLAAGLLGLLVLNTVLAQDAFRLHTLKVQSRLLEDREQVLQREVEALRAPSALAARAGVLGMVPAGPPAFLRLPDGAVLGAETSADVPELQAGAPADTAAPTSTTDSADAPDDGRAATDSTSDDTAPAEDAR